MTEDDKYGPWIAFNGGPKPLADDVKVQAQLRGNTQEQAEKNDTRTGWDWDVPRAAGYGSGNKWREAMATININDIESIEVRQSGSNAWLRISSSEDTAWFFCDYRLAERIADSFEDYHDWLSGQETGESD